jgi:hypothetical protein
MGEGVWSGSGQEVVDRSFDNGNEISSFVYCVEFRD